MTQDEIIAMAKEAGMVVVDDKFSLAPFLARFAALVAEKAAAEEREALVKLCKCRALSAAYGERSAYMAALVAEIRARCQKGGV